MSTLKDYAYYVEDKIDNCLLTNKTYIGVDNLLPNKSGITLSNYKPNEGKSIKFQKNDILIGNIRPYFKKIWLATFNGGCNTDVLCIRPKNALHAHYLYSVLSQDSFFDYDMAGAKGSKMPRGDKKHIMNFPIKVIDNYEQIGKIIIDIELQIKRNNELAQKLQVLALAIYKRWFIQFDYPNADKNLVYNNELKREIPDDWEVINLDELMRKINLIVDDAINSPTIDLSVMPSSNISLIELNNSEKFSTNLNKMIEGNILFGSIRPYLKKCGIAPCNGKVAGTVYQFEESKKDTYNYSLITIAQDSFFDYALKVSKGTRMPVVSAEDILAYKLPYNQKIVSLYNKLPIKKMIVSINKATIQLKELREKLLPLLVNGQLQ